MLCSFISSILHFSHLIFVSSGIGSSQSKLRLHNSCSIDFPWSIRGATKPIGSYVELIVDRIPRLVHVLSCRTTLNSKLSDSTHHWTPSVRSKGSVSRSRSISLTPSALSLSGMFLFTSLLFGKNLWRLNPPWWHMAFTFFTNSTADAAVATDFKPSST